MQFGIIGSGSWATALAKILADNRHVIHWWFRDINSIRHIQQRHHNPHYLNSAYFDPSLLKMSTDINDVVKHCDVVVMAVPSAYIAAALSNLSKDALKGKLVVSAIKGILPETNQLLNEYLAEHFDVAIENYYTLLGPCHAEEVASEKLSYLTFSGLDEEMAATIAAYFRTHYMNTVTNHDVNGVQYAAVLKNIYALGAGIAHGLEYGDNFLSVYIANSADEMVKFSRKVIHDFSLEKEGINYAASVYLGDLLVTCYSLYSRNRTFGNMIGKGYSVKAAQLELNMVAEGYNASRCIFQTNRQLGADIPIATTIYRILWEHLPPEQGFREIEKHLQ
ncbi:MAG TPA: NAD(P)H-dependent glycerol-3-phosphate dehydrogenase [Chitinophagaceae bacterium]